MTALAPTLQAFFTDRPARQRHASGQTVAAYRDAWRLLLAFAAERTGKQPGKLDFADLDAPLIGDFLDHLERRRGNVPRTRNARLAAIRSMFAYAALRHPEHAETIARVLAIPSKKYDRALVTWLTEPEVDALLKAPDKASWAGRRDHAMLTLDAQTGLRVSELTSLTCGDAHLSKGPHVSCHGKGRKERITPLTEVTVTVLQAWLAERHGDPGQPLFPTAPAGSSAAMPSRSASPSTSRPQPESARHSRRRTSPPTRSGTPQPCACSTPASTPRSSRSGSATSKPTPRRSTCTPTSSSRRKLSPGPPRQTQSPGATSHRTSSWPSSKASDYADLSAGDQAATCRFRREVGITRRSA